MINLPERPRRGFKSKSPTTSSAPGADTQKSARTGWGAVTRHQISGWRFQIRRLANGVALHDTRMLSDPLRRQARALTVSALLAAVLLAGAFVMSIIKPAGITGGKPVLADRATGALYVQVNDQLHPVLNLASARLIVGKPDDPTAVKSSEIDKFPLGSTLGIPGAPSRMVQAPDRDARWMVCDAASGATAGATVIVGDPVGGSGRAAALPAATALLATSDSGTTWLIWDNKRARIDLRDTAVASAVGISVDTPAPRPINRQLLNLIPESNPLQVPFIANAGDPHGSAGPPPAPPRPSGRWSSTMKATSCATGWSAPKACKEFRRSSRRCCAPMTPTAWSNPRSSPPTRWPKPRRSAPSMLTRSRRCRCAFSIRSPTR